MGEDKLGEKHVYDVHYWYPTCRIDVDEDDDDDNDDDDDDDNDNNDDDTYGTCNRFMCNKSYCSINSENLQYKCISTKIK